MTKDPDRFIRDFPSFLSLTGTVRRDKLSSRLDRFWSIDSYAEIKNVEIFSELKDSSNLSGPFWTGF